MKTILFITDQHIGAHIKQIAGVFDRAPRYGWRVIEIERERSTRSLSDFIETWHAAGCIIECGGLTEPLDASVFGDIPIVYIDPPPGSPDGIFSVTNDADALVACAVKELTALGCTSYAYCGWSCRTSWNLSREEAFVAALRHEGKTCAVFDKEWHDTFAIQKVLSKWLVSLPRPVGVLAANDYTAEQVAGAAELAALDAPSDIAIVGIDNDELICENTLPTITSIELDFRESGRLATDLLNERMENPALSPREVKFGPLEMYRRSSTRALKTGDRRIRRAVERIRRDACVGLKASDVINEIGLSRRLAERRFFEATGRTILGEIQEVRFVKAKELLRDESIPIGLIAERCGIESDSYLKRFFKSRTGMTPREWRKSLKE